MGVVAKILGHKDIQMLIKAYGHTMTERIDKAVSYTHLRAHETRHDLVCRLLLEKKKYTLSLINIHIPRTKDRFRRNTETELV